MWLFKKSINCCLHWLLLHTSVKGRSLLWSTVTISKKLFGLYCNYLIEFYEDTYNVHSSLCLISTKVDIGLRNLTDIWNSASGWPSCAILDMQSQSFGLMRGLIFPRPTSFIIFIWLTEPTFHPPILKEKSTLCCCTRITAILKNSSCRNVRSIVHSYLWNQ